MMTLSELGAWQFNACLKSQAGWQMRARRLYRVAWLALKEAWSCKQTLDRALQKGIKEFGGGTPEAEAAQGYLIMEEACMLLAYCFENLLKAVWAGQHFKEVSNADKLPVELKTHDLLMLAQRAGIQLTEKETLALRCLHQHAEWQGRYMIPSTRAKTIAAFTNHLSADFLMAKFPGEPDWPDEIHSLIQKIVSALNQIPEERRF